MERTSGRLRPFTSRLAVAALVLTAVGGFAATQATPVAAADEFAPLDAPKRITDTRPIIGETVDSRAEGGGPLAAMDTMELQVAGRAAVPDRASAAVPNITVTDPAGILFFTVFPCDQKQPNSSNLNSTKDQIIANAVFAGLDGSGKVCIYTEAAANVIVDVTGYLLGTPPAATGRGCPSEFPAGTYPVGPYQMPAGRYVSENGPNSLCEFYRWNEETFIGGQLG